MSYTESLVSRIEEAAASGADASEVHRLIADYHEAFQIARAVEWGGIRSPRAQRLIREAARRGGGVVVAFPTPGAPRAA